MRWVSFVRKVLPTSLNHPILLCFHISYKFSNFTNWLHAVDTHFFAVAIWVVFRSFFKFLISSYTYPFNCHFCSFFVDFSSFFHVLLGVFVKFKTCSLGSIWVTFWTRFWFIVIMFRVSSALVPFTGISWFRLFGFFCFISKGFTNPFRNFFLDLFL